MITKEAVAVMPQLLCLVCKSVHTLQKDRENGNIKSQEA